MRGAPLYVHPHHGRPLHFLQPGGMASALLPPSRAYDPAASPTINATANSFFIRNFITVFFSRLPIGSAPPGADLTLGHGIGDWPQPPGRDETGILPRRPSGLQLDCITYKQNPNIGFYARSALCNAYTAWAQECQDRQLAFASAQGRRSAGDGNCCLLGLCCGDLVEARVGRLSKPGSRDVKVALVLLVTGEQGATKSLTRAQGDHPRGARSRRSRSKHTRLRKGQAHRDAVVPTCGFLERGFTLAATARPAAHTVAGCTNPRRWAPRATAARQCLARR